MYPTLTWQQEALAIIKEKHNVILSEDDVFFTLGTHDASGALHFTMFVDGNDFVYTDYPLSLLYQRRNIARLFVGFLPEAVAEEGETYQQVLTRTMTKYGLDIPTTEFASDALNQVVSFGGGSDTVLTVDIDQSKSELWFGTFTIRAREDIKVPALEDTFKVVEPLTANYPEGGTGWLQTFDTFGILLSLSDSSDIPLLVVGDSPTGAIAQQLATTFTSLSFDEAWGLVTNTTVVYNGPVAGASGAEIDATLLPAFGTNVLILKPNTGAGLSSKLYYSYN